MGPTRVRHGSDTGPTRSDTGRGTPPSATMSRMQTVPPGSTAPPPPERRRRRRRLGGVASVSIALAVVAAATAVRAHRIQDPIPVTIDPATARGLKLLWTAAAGPGPAFPAAAGDTVYVATGTSLTAFPMTCTRTNGACDPRWTDPVTDGPLGPPVAQLGAVYTASSAGKLYVFPAQCQTSSCPPLWIGRAHRRPLSTAGVNSDYAYVASDRLYAFPAQCGSGGEICPPAWTAGLRPAGAWSSSPPAVARAASSRSGRRAARDASPCGWARRAALPRG